MRYDWKNTKTNEIVEHDHPSDPPSLPGEWQRIFSFGTGRVEGGGGSPSRASVGATHVRTPAAKPVDISANLKPVKAANAS